MNKKITPPGGTNTGDGGAGELGMLAKKYSTSYNLTPGRRGVLLL